MIQGGAAGAANIGGAIMVKAPNRKPRAFQTAVERSHGLDAHESRLRESLLLANRFEDARLGRLQRQLAASQQAHVTRILRRKDRLRVALIGIASSRRRLRASVCDFERRLRDGTNSPVFAPELERLRRKQRELSGLTHRLQAPNAQLLAAHVSDELRSIESRLDASPSRLVIASQQAPSVAGPRASVKPERGLDPVTAANNQRPKFREQIDTVATASMDDRLNEVHDQLSQANISQPDTSNVQPGSQDRHFPVTQSTDVEQPEMHPAESHHSANPVSNSDTPVRHKDVPANTVVAVEMPARELPPLKGATKSKKQRYLALMQQKLSRTGGHGHRGEPEISNSALQRERRAKRRVSELGARTREDIQGRRTADSDDSLGSIRRQEVVTRLQTTRKGSVLPSVGEEPENSGAARARAGEKARERERKKARQPVRGLATNSAAVNDVSLPPLRIDVDVLKELKASRLRHRNQSLKLPKLP